MKLICKAINVHEGNVVWDCRKTPPMFDSWSVSFFTFVSTHTVIPVKALEVMISATLKRFFFCCCCVRPVLLHIIGEQTLQLN